MFQFLSINFFSWISSIFVGFFKSSRFFVSPCTTDIYKNNTNIEKDTNKIIWYKRLIFLDNNCSLKVKQLLIYAIYQHYCVSWTKEGLEICFKLHSILMLIKLIRAAWYPSIFHTWILIFLLNLNTDVCPLGNTIHRNFLKSRII